jgi:hypothetical protein
LYNNTDYMNVSSLLKQRKTPGFPEVFLMYFINQLSRDGVTREDIEYETCECPSEEDNDDTDDGIDNDLLTCLFTFVFFT